MAKKKQQMHAKSVFSLLFGKLSIVILLMLVQLAILLVAIILLGDHFVAVYGFLTALSVTIAVWLVSKDENPAYKLAWIIPILIFPIFGGLFYLMFGNKSMPKKLARRITLAEKSAPRVLAQDASCVEELREAEKNGCPYEEMALLFRTNLGCRTAVEELMEAQIPFQMRDALPDLYDHWIAKDLLTYLNLAMGSRKRGEFLKIANRPNRYLSRDAFEEATVSFDALLEYYEEKDWMCQRIRKLEQDITTLTHLSPFGAVNYIRYAIGYEQYVKEYAAYRHLKEDDLISVLDELQEAAKSQKSIEGWFAHIEEYQQKMKEKQKQRAESAEGVMVSTLHSVKGLEYDKVYLLDVNEGVMPYQKAVLAEAIEEERRMFYVGMTRARKELTLCYVEERFEKKVEPSRFLDEVIQ